MYWRPELADAHDRYWALLHMALHHAGIESPEHLTVSTDTFVEWLDPELVLSQTCGMPYRTQLHDRVSLVGTPDFGVEGCRPGYYNSVFVVRASDERTAMGQFAQSTFAYNDRMSQSGYAAPFHHLRPLGFWFESQLHTGRHAASAAAVADGSADVASLDAVAWRLLQNHDAIADQLSVLEVTAPTPGLPYISRRGADVATLFEAVRSAIRSLQPDDRQALGLLDLTRIPPADYFAVPNP
jgi:ABC-type phosphate/phosphonate transport system substrate-binding protein